MTPSNDQIRAEMKKIGALREPEPVNTSPFETTYRAWYPIEGEPQPYGLPDGGDADSHCQKFQSCEAGFMWDCTFSGAKVCDNDHGGKLKMKLSTHGCNNCSQVSSGGIDYSWWAHEDKGSKPDKDSNGWSKRSDTSSITIVPGKDYSVGNAIWLKQQAICGEYKGEKNKTIHNIFKLRMVACGDQETEGCKNDDDCNKNGYICKDGDCVKDEGCVCSDASKECCSACECPKAKHNCCSGVCQECCRDSHCADGMECVDGKCQTPAGKKGNCVTIS